MSFCKKEYVSIAKASNLSRSVLIRSSTGGVACEHLPPSIGHFVHLPRFQGKSFFRMRRKQKKPAKIFYLNRSEARTCQETTVEPPSLFFLRKLPGVIPSIFFELAGKIRNIDIANLCDNFLN